MAKGKFVMKITASGAFRFDLLASNGQVIATSENYQTKASCINGIESVKKNAVIAKIEDQTLDQVVLQSHPKFEMYKDKSGEYRFRLKARNGEIIAVSEGYKQKVSCVNGMESVTNNAPEAEIKEEIAE